jgi:hypothetical protein
MAAILPGMCSCNSCAQCSLYVLRPPRPGSSEPQIQNRRAVGWGYLPYRRCAVTTLGTKSTPTKSTLGTNWAPSFAIVHLGAFRIENAPTLVATRSCPVATGAHPGCSFSRRVATRSLVAIGSSPVATESNLL